MQIILNVSRCIHCKYVFFALKDNQEVLVCGESNDIVSDKHTCNHFVIDDMIAKELKEIIGLNDSEITIGFDPYKQFMEE